MASVFKRGGSRAKGPWYASWKDHLGKRRTKCTNTTDKATAERIARKHEADAALRREGVIDATLDAISRESQRTIESHLLDYESKMRAAGCTTKHVTGTMRMIRSIAESAGFTIVSDINADAVNRYASNRIDSGKSARTVQSHLTAVKGFTKWLASNQKLARDPLVSVKKPNPKADRRLQRRVLLPEEWHLLKAATLAGPERCGMTGAERALLYETAIQTGLRSNEIRCLTRGRVVHSASRPYIVARSDSTKNSRDARQYIQPETALKLKLLVRQKAPLAPVFNLPHEANVAGMLRADLAEARKVWLKESIEDSDEYALRDASDFLADANEAGERLDFHALRHTCGAWLARAGANPKVVQSVMRHSTIVLTMDTYGHLFPDQEADAVDQMWESVKPEEEAVNLATGTCDSLPTPNVLAQRTAQQTSSELMREEAECASHCENPKEANVFRIAKLDEWVQGGAEFRENIRQATSNPQVAGSIPAGRA